jgi:hypothetical protein
VAGTNSGSPGSPEDALSPLAAALETAAKAAVAQTTGDPRVIAAVKLGWLLKELTEGWPLRPKPVALEVPPLVSSRAQANELTVLIAAAKLADLTGDAPSVTAMVKALQIGPNPVTAKALDTEVKVALVGAGARYQSAFVLGQGLRAMIPDATGTVSEPSNAMVNALDMLSSLLPSHAARGVANSMVAWQASDDPDKSQLAEAQVVLWRSVIVGEKRGTELLEPDDYVEAAKQLEHRYVLRTLKSPWFWVFAAVAVLLFAAGIVVLTQANGKTGTALAGVSGILAALGLSWKGIGGTIGKVVGKLEAPLWGAELDTAITDVITLAKPAGQRSQSRKLTYANRRSRVLDLKAHASQLPSGQGAELPGATASG